MTDLIVPGILLLVSLVSLSKKQDVYATLVEGAGGGLKILLSIGPSLVMLLTAVHLLRASGALTLLTRFLSPAAKFLGIPAETLPLVVVRPISGSAALAVGADLMATYGPDSLIGRTAAVMLGSTETTFYTISVYFGASGVRKTRYAVPAALIADLVGFLMASLTAKFLF